MEELNRLRLYTLLGNGIGLGCFLLGMLFMMSFSTGGVFLSFIGIIVLIISSVTVGKKFTSLYKELVCKDVIAKIFDVKEYRPKDGFEKDFVRNTYLIPVGNRYSSDDYLSGSYRGVEFERCDVCMQNVTNNGKTTTTTTYFEGSWTVFTFPKKISSYLMIREKEFLSGGRPGGIFSNAPRTDKVLFEDIHFNEKFEVYAEDEHDAFYVITPQFMECIKELEYKFDGRMIVGIMNQKVHILFDTRSNALEPSMLRKVTENDFALVENEMYKIIEIMKSLELAEVE